MAKKAKQNVDKIVKKVNKEFEKTSSQIEGLVNDALKQFDNLQNQVQEPVRKLLKEIDEVRDREMKRFQEEFERRLEEFHELQSNILDRLGVAAKESGADVKKLTDEVNKEAKAAAKKSAPKKTAKAAPKGKAASKPAAKKPAAKKPAARKAPAAKVAKPVDKSDLTLVKGIGPATAKKMKDAGITSIDQIANPSAADLEKLKAFSSVKGYSQFSAEAKKIS
ncbi:helix-hairpin-helix domain-containing protein [Marinobacter sp. F3R08]|uniref:helix-hairpin-helix domain-containing protein n=1 Tax=Marinobacter sp. F3R08 TaxID=2841559 RepID=UPI001C0908CE|nr:helix-hairpin-helix domain-containing protein [Marinobacter sp. F3R08]MBU2955780.1 hypothetical protein [Marinobacter sp. F3R08]